MKSQTSGRALELNPSPAAGPAKLYFQALFCLGLGTLWVSSLANGTVKALLVSAWTGRFENGMPLRVDYTGIYPLDYLLAVLVSFFFPGTSGQNGEFTLFLFDLYLLLQLGYLWLYVESLRPGVKPKWIQQPVYMALLWQAIGGAVSLPLYFLIHIQWLSAQSPRKVVDVDRARALPLSYVLGAVLPMLYQMAPTWLGSEARSSGLQQGIIASFQVDPLYVAGIFVLCTSVSTRLRGSRTEGEHGTSPANERRAGRWIRGTYLMAAALAAAGHVYVMLRVARESDESISKLNSMYSPFAAEGAPSEPDTITRGSWLFLQWDHIVISLAGISWILVLFQQGSSTRSPIPTVSILAFIVISLLLGPGTGITLALWMREGMLQEESEGSLVLG